MNPEFVEWANVVARWIHIIAGIMWVGNSMLFNWMDRNLRKGHTAKDAVGHVWLLHSGGFYFVEKTHLRSQQLPPFVHWFKWQSYSTWISGFCLVVLVYYMGGASYLIDPAVMKLTSGQAVGASLGLLVAGWLGYEGLFRNRLFRPQGARVFGIAMLCGVVYGMCHIFSGRGAYLQAGAMLGTLMAGNVFFHIIPAQRELYSSIRSGRGSLLSLARRAKQRSIHNNYFTFPLLFTMVSNHFGGLYGHKFNWLILLILFFMSGTARHLLNIRFTYKNWLRALFATFAIAGAALFAVAGPLFAKKAVMTSADLGAPVTFAEARAIINRRCIECHSIYPTEPAFAAATGGVHYDTPEEIKAKVDRIKIRACDLQTMPLANKTGMTDEERKILGRWIAQGAPIP